MHVARCWFIDKTCKRYSKEEGLYLPPRPVVGGRREEREYRRGWRRKRGFVDTKCKRYRRRRGRGPGAKRGKGRRRATWRRRWVGAERGSGVRRKAS
jgi:hypothetical protein